MRSCRVDAAKHTHTHTHTHIQVRVRTLCYGKEEDDAIDRSEVKRHVARSGVQAPRPAMIGTATYDHRWSRRNKAAAGGMQFVAVHGGRFDREGWTGRPAGLRDKGDRIATGLYLLFHARRSLL